MKTKNSIVEAAPSDINEISDLLETHCLPTKDISDSDINFFVISSENGLVACAGIELFGKKGLLRSVAVKEELRGKGIGSELIDGVLLKAQGFGISELYLLTETAEIFFSKKGFTRINRENAPESIKTSNEFAEVCPSSAILMMKKL